MADGYGNRRVIVFDADTGVYKRMWGAFGNMPTDGAPDLSQADAGADGSPQFIQPVHAARVSNDGLVYVSDRGGKRVQVFTIDGKFVSQVFIGRECRAPDCGNGTTAASTAFSPDAAQRFLFVGNRSQAKVMVFDRKTLALLDSFGRWGSAPGEFGTLHHMAADSKGNLYVTEVTPLKPENRRIQKFVYMGMQAPVSQEGAATPDLAVISARLGQLCRGFHRHRRERRPGVRGDRPRADPLRLHEPEADGSRGRHQLRRQSAGRGVARESEAARLQRHERRSHGNSRSGSHDDLPRHVSCHPEVREERAMEHFVEPCPRFRVSSPKNRYERSSKRTESHRRSAVKRCG